MTATVRKIVEQVQRLDRAEQEELRAQLDRLAPLAAALPLEQEYRRRLLASGLVTKFPLSPPTERTVHQPVEVQGKPVSETVLEERR